MALPEFSFCTDGGMSFRGPLPMAFSLGVLPILSRAVSSTPAERTAVITSGFQFNGTAANAVVLNSLF